MLRYINGRFYREQVSFAVPDGFYVEEDGEILAEYGFCAWDPRREYLCSWRFYENCLGTARELENWFLPDCGMTPLSDVTAIGMNGLNGHFVFYRTRREQYYEARFELGGGKELSFLVESQGGDIRRIAAYPSFQAALVSIRVEKGKGPEG